MTTNGHSFLRSNENILKLDFNDGHIVLKNIELYTLIGKLYGVRIELHPNKALQWRGKKKKPLETWPKWSKFCHMWPTLKTSVLAYGIIKHDLGST